MLAATLKNIYITNLSMDENVFSDFKLKLYKTSNWDAFICHAYEDKSEIAKPLFEKLTKSGAKVWYDDFVLKIGDSIREKVDHGLSKSNFGVVILSPNFFNKKWTQYELNSLITLELSSNKILLPIWHKVTKVDVLRYSPLLADKFAISSDIGVDNIVNKLIEVIQPISQNEKAKELIDWIEYLDSEVEKNKPTPRLESAEIASNLVELWGYARKAAQDVFGAVLERYSFLFISRKITELIYKIDWYIDLNG
jgi:hypothetical protein